MSDSKKKIYLGEDLVCQTFTDAEEQAKAFDLFGLEQPVVSSNEPASTRPVQQGQVCEFDGVDDYISAAHLTGSETVTSSVGTATPSISAGRIDFTAGKCSNLILSDGTQYNLNHASGTTAYDSSGNGNDGTLQNGAAFVVDNTLPPEADRLNLDGYTDDGGVLKPRDESDPTNDIDGNPLQYSGSVYPRRPEYRNSYAASFDGVDDYVETGSTLTLNSDFNISFTAKCPDISARRGLFGYDSNNFARINAATYIQFRWGGVNYFYTIPDCGNLQTYNFIKTGSVVELFVDGSSVGTNTVSTSIVINRIGSIYGSVETFLGEISNFNINNEAHYPLTEGAGDTVYDISGNGNHGTINNASTGTEGAGFWAGRIDGEANALNNNNGFSKRMLFDGVDDEVELNVSPNELMETGVFDMSVEIVWDSSNIASFGRLLWFITAGGFFRLQRDSNTSTFRLWARQGAGLDIIPKTGIVISADTNHVIRLVGDGVNCMIYLDGSLINTVTMNTANFYTPTWSKVSLGEASSSQFKGTIYNWSLITASITQQLNGYGNTNADWVDTSGNGNDGTVNGSPALLRIPADTSDPTKDVLGDTLTNPAITDGYNGAETELDAYNIAEGDNPSPATNNNSALESIEFGADFASNDAAYMRLKSSTENDRLITFADDLTGGDETLAQKYTQ